MKEPRSGGQPIPSITGFEDVVHSAIWQPIVGCVVDELFAIEKRQAFNRAEPQAIVAVSPDARDPVTNEPVFSGEDARNRALT
jgi:hypothetical protein